VRPNDDPFFLPRFESMVHTLRRQMLHCSYIQVLGTLGQTKSSWSAAERLILKSPHLMSVWIPLRS